jgi:hypothetical protein
MRTAMRTLLTIGAMLIWIGVAGAQTPGPRPAVLNTQSSPSGVVRTARNSAVVIERLTSFDTNADNLISRDELPERMQELVGRGDKNADAALDSDEIRALATTALSQVTRVSFRSQLSEGLPGVIRDLKLAPAKQERALFIVGVEKPPRHANDPASSALLAEMKALLDETEYEDFVAAATRLARTDLRSRMGGVVVGVPRRQ